VARHATGQMDARRKMDRYQKIRTQQARCQQTLFHQERCQRTQQARDTKTSRRGNCGGSVRTTRCLAAPLQQLPRWEVFLLGEGEEKKVAKE